MVEFYPLQLFRCSHIVEKVHQPPRQLDTSKSLEDLGVTPSSLCFYTCHLGPPPPHQKSHPLIKCIGDNLNIPSTYHLCPKLTHLFSGMHPNKWNCVCVVAAEGANGDIKSQLQIFKVMTALLCCALLLLLMVRFTRPTVKALQKRCEYTHTHTLGVPLHVFFIIIFTCTFVVVSDRRQNRWIGPTQSHSGEDNMQTPGVTVKDGCENILLFHCSLTPVNRRHCQWFYSRNIVALR